MKFIPNTNNKYYITENMEVFNAKTNRKLKPYKEKGAYVTNIILSNGKRKKYKIQSLYNMCFIPFEMKEIPGFDKKYSISKDGRIFSNIGYVELKPYMDKDGYKRISLVTKNGRKGFRINRLVALTYIPNIENKPIVNHLDGNKLNNNVDNLEWCTNSENIKHAIDNGLFIIKRSIDGRFLKTS